MAENTGFLQTLKNILEIQIGEDESTGEPVFARLAAGISTMEPQPNDELAQDIYLDGEGYGETDIIGAQLVIACTGHRLYGDPAQDFIFSKVLETGPGRRTTLRWTQPNGDVLEGPITIANISGPGGDAGAKGEIGFELHFNGKPTFTPASENGGGGVEG